MINNDDKPKHWFRHISEDRYGSFPVQPVEIEFLNMWTGKTYIHKGGTSYYDYKNKCLKYFDLMYSGITHFRIIK